MLAAGLLWLLMIYGEVVERDLRRAGMSTGERPFWARVRLGVTVVITTDGEVARQWDLHLEPHLSILGEGEDTGPEMAHSYYHR